LIGLLVLRLGRRVGGRVRWPLIGWRIGSIGVGHRLRLGPGLIWLYRWLRRRLLARPGAGLGLRRRNCRGSRLIRLLRRLRLCDRGCLRRLRL